MEEKEQNILTEEFQVIHIEKNEKKKRKPLAEHSGNNDCWWDPRVKVQFLKEKQDTCTASKYLSKSIYQSLWGF